MILLLIVRNILRNKKNSLSIVLLIGAITGLFFIGNSITGNGSRGLRRSFVDNMTADVLIEESGDVTMNLFGANTPVIEDFFAVPVLSAYESITALLDEMSEIESWTGQVSGGAALEIAGVREPALLCGIDGASYFNVFPGISLLEGRFLSGGEFGVMITAEKAQSIERRTGRRPAPGDPVLFTSAGTAGFKIREAPLVGIFSYRNPAPSMNEVVLADAQTVRVLAEIQVATAGAELSEESVSLLGQGASLDTLFGDDGGGAQSGGASAADGGAASGASSAGDLMEELSGLLSGNSDRLEEERSALAAGGDWNFIVVRLAPGESPERFIAKTRGLLAGYGAMAVGWRYAAGGQAIIALLVQALFNGGAFLVSIACILAVVNILLIAVFKRTREIGTLRAIGARDRYIRLLIFGENTALGLSAGLLGVIAGNILLEWVNHAHITVDNDLLASILGGKIIHFGFSPSLAALSLAVALVLSVLSSIFPVETAVKIAPVVAVQQG